MRQCISLLIVGNNSWPYVDGGDRAESTLHRCNDLSWNSLLLAPLYQSCSSPSYHNSSLVIFPLTHTSEMFLLSYPFQHQHELVSVTLKMEQYVLSKSRKNEAKFS